MEDSVTSSFAKTAQALAEKAADKAKSGTHAGSKLVQSASRQGLDAITEMAGQARDVASSASDSIVTYTKKNPIKALAIAAASGALLYAAIKAMLPSRD
jgi:ElaB/YqjD/DUF883 family membrane-anchored ribosome-binding protein